MRYYTKLTADVQESWFSDPLVVQRALSECRKSLDGTQVVLTCTAEPSFLVGEPWETAEQFRASKDNDDWRLPIEV